MDDPSLIDRYNYDEFVPSKFEPWMNFDASPTLGATAPDFPLWTLTGEATRLGAVWAQHAFTVVEFGSFT